MASAQGPLLVCTGDLLGSADAYAPGPGTYERAGNIYASLVGSLVRHDDDGAATNGATATGAAGEEDDDNDDDDGDDDEGRRRTAAEEQQQRRRRSRPLLAVTSARALARAPASSSAAYASAVVVPRPGDAVTGRVTRVGPAAAQVALLVLSGGGGGVGGGGGGGVGAAENGGGAPGRALPTFPGASPFPASAPSAGAFRGVVRRQDVRRTDVDGVVMRDCFRPGDIVRCAVLSLGGGGRGGGCCLLSTAANELGVVAARCASSGAGMVPVSWQEMACPLTGTVERRKVARVVGAAAAAAAAEAGGGAP